MTNVMIGVESGMGVAVARELAPRGPLIVADRSLDPVQALAAELGDHVVPAARGVTDHDQVDQLVARIDELDALLLTAGISGSMGAGRQSLEDNLIGTARVLRALETVLGHSSVAVCFASMSGHRVPQ